MGIALIALSKDKIFRSPILFVGFSFLMISLTILSLIKDTGFFCSIFTTISSKGLLLNLCKENLSRNIQIPATKMIFKNLYFFFILSILHPLHYAVIEGIYISCTYCEQNIKILTFDFIKCSRKGRNFFILQIYFF